MVPYCEIKRCDKVFLLFERGFSKGFDENRII